MAWLALIVVAFLLITAVVIALARSSTARWERAKRAPVAARRVDVRPGSSAAWLAAPLWRKAAAVRRSRTVRRAPGLVAPGRPRSAPALLLSGLAGLPPRLRALRSSLYRVLRRTAAEEEHRTPGARPGDGTPADPTAPAGAAAAPGGDDADRSARRRSSRRIASRRRPTFRLPHRPERSGDPRGLGTGSDESTGAR